MKRFVPHVLGAVAAAVLAWLVMAGGTAAVAPVTPVADEAPGYAVEDFDYPQADKIAAERGITLKRGDGHIVLATCDSEAGLLEVWARSSVDRICFRTTGDSGFLTLEIPSVFSVRGNDYSTQVDMTVDGEEKSYDIEKNTWTPVGESAEQGREYALVEIRTTK
ncbi:hypothetical protein [Streptomyces flavalbus]|uniref:Secreted protein n=1 Tax=Streptomyces flavalbus TaxID=2665155 RepID=A0ABW2WEF6_9ACTN